MTPYELALSTYFKRRILESCKQCIQDYRTYRYGDFDATMSRLHYYVGKFRLSQILSKTKLKTDYRVCIDLLTIIDISREKEGVDISWLRKFLAFPDGELHLILSSMEGREYIEIPSVSQIDSKDSGEGMRWRAQLKNTLERSLFIKKGSMGMHFPEAYKFLKDELYSSLRKSTVYDEEKFDGNSDQDYLSETKKYYVEGLLPIEGEVEIYQHIARNMSKKRKK